MPHRGAAVSREWELALSAPSEGATAAAALAFDEPFAEYAPTSFWTTPPGGGDAPGARPFLLMPLNEIQDEHYTVYFCKPASPSDARRPPRFCV